MTIYDFKLNIENCENFKTNKPEDRDFCFVIFGNEKQRKCFWCDMGFGGLFLGEKNVIKWIKWEDVSLQKED